VKAGLACGRAFSFGVPLAGGGPSEAALVGLGNNNCSLVRHLAAACGADEAAFSLDEPPRDGVAAGRTPGTLGADATTGALGGGLSEGRDAGFFGMGGDAAADAAAGRGAGVLGGGLSEGRDAEAFGTDAAMGCGARALGANTSTRAAGNPGLGGTVKG
jgi:hypothetical protein